LTGVSGLQQKVFPFPAIEDEIHRAASARRAVGCNPVQVGLMGFVLVNARCTVGGIVFPAQAQGGSAGTARVVSQNCLVSADLEVREGHSPRILAPVVIVRS